MRVRGTLPLICAKNRSIKRDKVSGSKASLRRESRLAISSKWGFQKARVSPETSRAIPRRSRVYPAIAAVGSLGRGAVTRPFLLRARSRWIPLLIAILSLAQHAFDLDCCTRGPRFMIDLRVY